MFTIPIYESPSHRLTLENAYGVINSITLSYHSFSDTEGKKTNQIQVSAGVIIYSSKKAYDENAEPIHHRQVSFQSPNDDLALIKTAIATELNKK